MNFDFSDDQKLLQTATRDFLEDKSPLTVNRSVLENGEPMDAALWTGAAEMGWLGTVIPESFGGAGFGHLEQVLVCEELGRALAPIPYTSSSIAVEALLEYGSAEQQSSMLPAFADGSAIGTVAIAEGKGIVRPDTLNTVYENGSVTGTKVAVPDGVAANQALVIARSADGTSLAMVDLTANGVTQSAAESIDPGRPVAELRFENAPAQLIGDAGAGWSALQDILDRGAVIAAFEQLGSAQRAFDITREYILDRYAFGRQIASFQAIKHRMADMYAALELARSNCFYGAWALSNSSDELKVAAPSARISASDAFDLCSQEMIQMHGGVGFTWEFDCHMFYRRAKQLGHAIGTANEWRDKLIDRLVDQQVA
ncbi:MAG: acyl-CoA dehydrogenase family protein [Pseudomonadota bacterium]